jgi:hypothetical protein
MNSMNPMSQSLHFRRNDADSWNSVWMRIGCPHFEMPVERNSSDADAECKNYLKNDSMSFLL